MTGNDLLWIKLYAALMLMFRICLISCTVKVSFSLFSIVESSSYEVEYELFKVQKLTRIAIVRQLCGQQSESIAEHRQMEDLLISKEEIDELVRRRPQLDAKSKYLLEGKYILGESDEVMAEELPIKPASVRMALTRARQCAYQLLTKELTPSRS